MISRWSKSRALITGVTGFVGSHLAEYLLTQDVDVFGMCRWRSNRENIQDIVNDITLVHGDLLDQKSLVKIFTDNKFDYVFHLAAQSYVQTSFDASSSTLETNVVGTNNLLEAIRTTKSDPVIHICSSSEVYGQVDESNVPITEECPFAPASPYAVSKVGEDMIALQYWLSYGVKTIRTRMFTHTGPRRGDVFFLSAFAKQIAAVELGMQDELRVGNLNSIRTMLDVRDAVRAYWEVVNKCDHGEVYNIGGKETMSVGDALIMLITLAKTKIHYITDKSLLRPSDVTLQIPCVDKFKNKTGWEQKIPFKKTCDDLLDYWREELIKNPWKLKTLEK